MGRAGDAEGNAERSAGRSRTATTIPNVDDKGVEYQIVAAPVQFNETAPPPARAPEHGQHTEEILLELDLDWDDISAAKDSGAIL